MQQRPPFLLTENEMTTVLQQLEMFYAGGRLAAKKLAYAYIKSRSKIRFHMVEHLRSEGKLESDWDTIKEFDDETDKQVKIFEDHFKNIS